MVSFLVFISYIFEPIILSLYFLLFFPVLILFLLCRLSVYQSCLIYFVPAPNESVDP